MMSARSGDAGSLMQQRWRCACRRRALSVLALGILSVACAEAALAADSVQELQTGTYGPPGPPRSADSKPSASPDPRVIRGVYLSIDPTLLLPGVRGELPPFNAAGKSLFWSRANALLAGKLRDGDPPVECRPWGAVRVINSSFPMQVIQTPGRVTLLWEEDHLVRRVYLNQSHPRDLVPTVMGDSVGHWDGDALVVDTIGFKGGGWMDEYGSPSSASLHLIERWHKLSGGQQLEDEVQVQDRVYYTRSFSFHEIFQWRPDLSWDEIICEENNRDLAPDSALRSAAGGAR